MAICLKILIYALVLFLCQKTGRFSLFFHDYFSRIHKIKTRTYINNLRQGSLHINVFYKYVKSYDWEMNIKRDISVQKIKVKKSNFKFLIPSFLNLFVNCNITHRPR